MLFKNILSATIFLSGLSLASPVENPNPAHSVTHHDDGRVEITLRGPDQLEKRKIYLTNWSGCDTTQKEDVIAAWKNMLDMANKIRGTVNFDEAVARDFLGPSSRNQHYQKAIQTMIDEVTSWKLGSLIDWHLEMTCDDPDRNEKIAKHNGDLGCPAGTADADKSKCSSRCWQYYTKSDGSVREWFTRGFAYTTNWHGVHVGRMNWCPSWFNERRPCLEKYNELSRRTGQSKWEIHQYQCREQAMVHELFHLDAHSSQNSQTKIDHVYDRVIKVYDEGFGGERTVLANGATWTKALANYDKSRVGFFAATNADNLAFYFLGKWVMKQGGYYPDLPRVDDKPVSTPTTTSSKKRDDDEEDSDWDPIVIKDNKVAIGDLDDLAEALNTTTENAVAMYEVADMESQCDDLLSSDDNSTVTCYTTDDDKNDPIELDASLAEDNDDDAATTTTSAIGPLRTCNEYDVQHRMTYEQASDPISKFCGEDGYLWKNEARISYQEFAAKEQMYGFSEGASKYHVHLRVEGSNATMGDGCQLVNFELAKKSSKVYCNKQLKSVLDGCGAFVKTDASWKVGGTLDESCLKWTLERRSIDTDKYPDCKGTNTCCEDGCDVVE